MNPAIERQRFLFREALLRPSGPEREAFLDQACAGDPALRATLQALLDAHASPDSFLESPVEAPPATGPSGSTPQEGPGTRIGRYKLLERIGEGGFGVVYVAEQQEPVKRRVALKIIKLGMDTRQVVARFEAERQALALMDHPNIAKVLDAAATDTGRPYFVMELVRGVRITDYCDQNNLSTEERLRLFVQICHAIQHAHQKGIIHRDIKPSNILVTINDGVAVPKVIDFGIAKATQGELTDKTVYTQLHQFIGTPAYMSPEQAVMTSVDVDTRSDIYGLGVLLYELLTGHTPFDQKELLAAGVDEMRRIIREQEPMRPSTRLSTLNNAEQTTVAERRHSEPPQLIHLVRGDLDWIVMKCLEKDRTRRYETANGLADDVMRHLEDEPVLARPPGRVYRLQKLVRRNKMVFGAAAVVVSALIIGLGLATWMFLKEQAARKAQSQLKQQAQAEAKKSEQVAQFLKDMLQGVGPSVAMGRDTAMLKEILDKTAERVGKDLRDQPETEAELRSTLGDVYHALSLYTNAESMYRTALTIRRGLWGNLNTKVADSLDGLGWAVDAQEWLADKAEPFFQEALSIRTNLLGTEHPAIAASLFNLGWVRVGQARMSEAERLFRESLAMRRRIWGNDHAEVAKTLSALANALYEQNRFVESENAARDALAIQARLSGGESVWDDEVTHARLGFALYLQDKLDEAEVVLRQAVSSTGKVLGMEHGGVIQPLDILALVLIEKGELEEAQTLARKAVATSKRLFGDRHPETALALEVLGSALRKAGRLADAESAFREAVAICEQRPMIFGPESRVRPGLVAVLKEQGKLAEVETFYQEDLAAQRRASNQVARRREARLLVGWGDFLRDQGKPAQAEALYREGLALCRQSVTNDFEARQWLAGGFCTLLRNQGRLAEAEAVGRETLEAGRKLPLSSELARALLVYGDVLRDQGKLAEAESSYREGLAISRTVSNDFEAHSWLASSLAGILKNQGKLTEAEALYRETIDAGRKSNDSHALAGPLANLGDMLRDQGQAVQAESLYREGLHICRQHPTADFEPRRVLAEGLVSVFRSQGKSAEAESLYRETLEAGRKLPPSADLARVLAAFGDLLRDQGRLAESQPLYREGLDLCRRLAANDSELHQWLAAGLGFSLRNQGKLAEAEAFYLEAVTNAAKVWPNNPARWQWQVSDLAQVLRSLGKSGEADQLEAQMLKPGARSASERIAALRTRIDLSGRRGHWKEAAADLSNLLELEPEGAYAHLQLAAVLVQTGDLDAYRAHCGKMLARFGATNDAVIADQTAKACLLVPGAAGGLETASQLAERALTLGKDNPWFSYLQMDKGLAEYRRGQYASAVDWMRKVIGQPMNVGRPLPAWQRDVAAHSVLAMAQRQLNQAEEARAALAKASELAQTKLPQLGRDNLEQDWVDWVIAHILLREAQALVTGQPKTTGQ